MTRIIGCLYFASANKGRKLESWFGCRPLVNDEENSMVNSATPAELLGWHVTQRLGSYRMLINRPMSITCRLLLSQLGWTTSTFYVGAAWPAIEQHSSPVNLKDLSRRAAKYGRNCNDDQRLRAKMAPIQWRVFSDRGWPTFHWFSWKQRLRWWNFPQWRVLMSCSDSSQLPVDVSTLFTAAAIHRQRLQRNMRKSFGWIFPLAHRVVPYFMNCIDEGQSQISGRMSITAPLDQ